MRSLFRFLFWFFHPTPFYRLFVVTLIFGVAPALINGYVAYYAFFDLDLSYSRTAQDCYLTAVAATTVTLASAVGFTFHGLGPKKTLLALCAQSAFLIVAFAGLYRGYGLCVGGTCIKPIFADSTNNNYHSMINDGVSPLYFSISTWTTLGYGDYLAPHDIKLLAASEALLGNLSFGTAVGLLTYLLCRERSQTTGRRIKIIYLPDPDEDQ
jgi:hypothetical protein